jgi:hypothetical protein
MSPRWGSSPRLTDRLTVGRNVTQTQTEFKYLRKKFQFKKERGTRIANIKLNNPQNKKKLRLTNYTD